MRGVKFYIGKFFQNLLEIHDTLGTIYIGEDYYMIFISYAYVTMTLLRNRRLKHCDVYEQSYLLKNSKGFD